MEAGSNFIKGDNHRVWCDMRRKTLKIAGLDYNTTESTVEGEGKAVETRKLGVIIISFVHT